MFTITRTTKTWCLRPGAEPLKLSQPLGQAFAPEDRRYLNSHAMFACDDLLKASLAGVNGLIQIPENNDEERGWHTAPDRYAH